MLVYKVIVVSTAVRHGEWSERCTASSYSLDDGTVTHADFTLEIPVVKCTCFQKRIADVFLHAVPAIVEKNFMALDSGSVTAFQTVIHY